MPGNEIEERIRFLYELDNFSLGQHQSQAVYDNQPVLIHDQWVEKQKQIGRPLSFNLNNNYSGQQLDSLRGHGGESLSPFDHNYGQLTPRSDLSRSQSIVNQELNANGFMLGQQNFQARQNQLEFLDEKTGFIPHNLSSLTGLSVLKSQQEYASGDSPTLTTNSERSEMTDASTEFNFVGGQQKLVRGQQTGIPQPIAMQQSGYNDVHMLQQHLMFKQLQEFQKQQQLQQFGEARQHNSLNQLSSIAKQASGVHPALISGTPVNETPQMFMNWVQRGASPVQQGLTNRNVFPQEQSQTVRSVSIPQQFDASLYGTPVASARGTMSQYSHVQGMSHDSPNRLNKFTGQVQKPVTHSPAISNPFMGDQCTLSPDQAYLSQDAFMAKQGFQGKNMFGQVPLQGLNSGSTLGNSLLGTSLQANPPLPELSGKQEPAGWPGLLQQKPIQHGPSQQGLVSLDPMEEKILFNTDDDVWNSSFERRSDMVAGGFANALEDTEYSNAFPSLQSGSWSALMQSAVAEASSSDTGLQEEWSGLTFQNTELSTDNQTSNILESEKQQKGWPDNNLQSDSSLGSKPLLMPNDSSICSTFPGFHPTGLHFMTKQRDDLLQDDSHESIQRSPKETSEWVDCNPQPTLSIQGGEQAQQLMQLDNTWAGQINNAHQQRIPTYDDGVNEPSSKPEGYTIEAMYKRRDTEGFPWKAASDGGLSSFSRTTGGLAQVQSDVDNNVPRRENSQLFNFATVPASCMAKVHQETSQQLGDSNRLDYMKQVKVSMNDEESDETGVKLSQMGNIANIMQNSYGAPEMHGQQRSNYSRDSYNSEGSKGHKQRHPGQFKVIGDATAVSLDQGHLPNFQGGSREPEKSPRGDLDRSATFHRSIGSGGPNINAEARQDMLELLPKVDQSKENATIQHFGSTSFNPLSEVADTGSAQTPIAQMYNQSSGSQGFALRLSPPSQQLANSNNLFSQGLPQTVSNLNSRRGHFNQGEKNQAQLPPFPSLPPSNELSPREGGNNKFNTSEQRNMSPSLHIHQSSVAAIPSNPPYSKHQLQMRLMPNGPLSGPSSQPTFQGINTGYPPFNLAPSKDTSQQIQTHPSGRQFLGLEAVPMLQPRVMSDMLQQGGILVRSQSLWTNAQQQQQLSGIKPYKVDSVDPPSNSMETTSLNQQQLTDDTQKSGNSQLRACSVTSQGPLRAGDQPKEEGLERKISPEMINASQTVVTSISDKSALSSGSVLAHQYRQNLEKLHYSHNHSPTGSERSHESFDHSIKPTYSSHQSYSLLRQVQAMKNVETDQSSGVLNLHQGTTIAGHQSAHEQNSTSTNSKDDGLNSHLNRLSSGGTKRLSFPSEARKDLSMKVPSQPAPLEDITSQAIQNDFTSQPSGSNVVSNQVENSLANVSMVQSLYNQYATLRNGQIPPMYGAKLVGTAGVQFSLVKPSQTFGVHSSVERLDGADGSYSGRVLPSTAVPCIPSSDAIGQSVNAVKPKKRKTMISEGLPWHKEVTQGFKRFQDISVAEKEWAQASNRIIEKVEGEAGTTEDGPPIVRNKRRLVLTTQLMQQLLCPAPAPVFAANAALQYDGVVYFVARLSLGDACSLTFGKINNLCKPLVDSNMISEELNASDTESTNAQCFSKAVDAFTCRAKKLESELLRLDKTASMLDLRLEHQELEKVSVINRFAKFHVRTADVSGTTSSSGTAGPRVCPQRYITPHPMPNNVPEGVQCLSL